MLSLSGISAWIEVDGKELDQHSVEEDHGRNQVTCWIATQTGKAFSVVFRDNAAYSEHSLSSSLSLDGTPITGRVIHPTQPRIGAAPIDRKVVQSDQMLSTTTGRPFMFSKLELTDDDEYLNQSSTHLGEIRISIYRVQLLESQLPVFSSGASAHGKVHERSKKAVTHCVSYGQEVKTETRYSCRLRYLDGTIPLATFIFRYRDSELLQANGIIPKPPPAKNVAAASEEVLDLTTEDDADVKREPVNDEHTTRKRPSVSSKRSNPGQESQTRPAKKMKREKKNIPAGEVIDLT